MRRQAYKRICTTAGWKPNVNQTPGFAYTLRGLGSYGLCVFVILILILYSSTLSAQSPFESSKQSHLFSNAQAGVNERWLSIMAPSALSANYRLIMPTVAPTVGQLLNVSSISGNDCTLQWSGGVTGSGTATQVAFWSGTSTLSSSSNLFWDNTNIRLGIGTSTPSKALDVHGPYTGSNVVTVQNTSSTGFSSIDFYSSANALSTTFGFANSGVGGFFANRSYMNCYGNDFVLTHNSGTYDIFIQGSSGNVGINNSNPASTLDVTGNLSLSNTGTAGELRLYEPSAAGSNYSSFKSTTQSANINYTLPSADGSSGAVLKTDGSGALSWSNVGIVKYARKSANESVTSSTTLQNDDHMVLSVNANEVWECEIFFRVVVTSNTNGGVQMQLNVPTGSTVLLQSQAWIGYDAASGYIGQDILYSPTNFYYTGLKTDANGGNLIRIHGMINVGSTAGNVQWQFAQQSSSAVATTGASDSYIKLQRIQ